MLIPRHVAIIMDGNNRWAKKKQLASIRGHRAGVAALRRTIRTARELGIEYLTLYAFSVDNWKRSPQEVDSLMNLMREFLRKEKKEFIKQDIRLIVIGNEEKVPEDILRQIREMTELTRNHKKLKLVMAFNYGARAEIVTAAKKAAADVLKGKISIEEISEKVFEQYLYTKDIPDPDLLIRTSGEMRVSNFLLWQISYSELWITPVYWPDFNKKHFLAAIEDFSKRKRRYGGRVNVS